MFAALKTNTVPGTVRKERLFRKKRGDARRKIQDRQGPPSSVRVSFKNAGESVGRVRPASVDAADDKVESDLGEEHLEANHGAVSRHATAREGSLRAGHVPGLGGDGVVYGDAVRSPASKGALHATTFATSHGGSGEKGRGPRVASGKARQSSQSAFMYRKLDGTRTKYLSVCSERGRRGGACHGASRRLLRIRGDDVDVKQLRRGEGLDELDDPGGGDPVVVHHQHVDLRVSEYHPGRDD